MIGIEADAMFEHSIKQPCMKKYYDELKTIDNPTWRNRFCEQVSNAETCELFLKRYRTALEPGSQVTEAIDSVDGLAPSADVIYTINMDKIATVIADPWRPQNGDFAYCDVAVGTTPRTIVINESHPLHMVQLLYIVKEKSWGADQWVPFTEENLLTWAKADYVLYIENNKVFGQAFVEKFPTMIKKFLVEYCESRRAE